MNTKLILIGAALIALLFAGCGLYGYANSLQQEGVARENELNAQYQSNQLELDTYITKFHETIGVANLKSQQMDQILTDAVKGRYEGHTSAQPGQGQLFSAIKEAYPQLDLSLYDRILDIISAGRESYKQKQTKLLDMLRSYDTWRQSGIVRSRLLKGSFPSDSLTARIGTDVKHGQSALDQMYLIVLTTSTTDAYKSGHMEPLEVPGLKPTK